MPEIPLAPGRRIWLRRRIPTFLGIVAIVLLIGTIVWVVAHRDLLFEVPATWNELLRAREEILRGESDGNPATVDRLAVKLIRLQDPDFAGGEFFQLQEIPTERGASVMLLCYEPERGERVPHPAWRAEPPGIFERHHRFVTGRGRLFVPRSTAFLAHGVGGVHDHGDDYRTRRGIYWTAFPPEPGSPPVPTPGVRLYTWSRDGFRPQGFVRDDARATPWPAFELPGKRSYQKQFEVRGRLPLDRRNLDSDDPVEILIGLERLEHLLHQEGPGRPGERDPGVWRRLLVHADPEVRARALSFVPPSDAHETAMRLLDDPSPRVRLTAVHLLRQGDCRDLDATWEALTGDPDPFVAAQGLRGLLESGDREIARPALVEFLQNRTPAYLGGRIPERCCSPESALLALEWLEDLCRSTDSPSRPWSRDFGAIIEALSSRHLRPHAPRLLEIFESLERDREETRLLWHALSRALLRLEDPGVDETLLDFGSVIWPCLTMSCDLGSHCSLALTRVLLGRPLPAITMSLTHEHRFEIRWNGRNPVERVLTLYHWGEYDEHRLSLTLGRTLPAWRGDLERSGDPGSILSKPEVILALLGQLPRDQLLSPGVLAVVHGLPEPLPDLVSLIEEALGDSAEGTRASGSSGWSRSRAVALSLLHHWKVPGALERLRDEMTTLDPGDREGLRFLSGRPELLEHEFIRELWEEMLDAGGVHPASSRADSGQGGDLVHLPGDLIEEESLPGWLRPRENPLDAFLDALEVRHPRVPLEGAIPGLRRLARAGLRCSLRAAKQLESWEIEGARDVVFQAMSAGCTGAGEREGSSGDEEMLATRQDED